LGHKWKNFVYNRFIATLPLSAVTSAVKTLQEMSLRLKTETLEDEIAKLT